MCTAVRLRAWIDVAARDHLADEIRAALVERTLEQRLLGSRGGLLAMDELVRDDRRQLRGLRIHLRGHDDATAPVPSADREAANDEIHVGKNRAVVQPGQAM